MKLKFFNVAKKLSSLSNHKKPMGCVVVRGKKIISRGYNIKKTHPESHSFYNLLHAEHVAILNAYKQDLKGCEVYVYRETKDGLLGNSRPCVYCERILRSSGIKKVFYTTREGEIKSETY